MYRIRNISLDSIFEENNVKSLDELSESKLLELCSRFGVVAAYKTEPKKGVIFKKRQFAHIVGIDSKGSKRTEMRWGTCDLIEMTNSVSFYMSYEYWTPKQRKKAEDRDMDQILDGITKGAETFKFFESLKFGVYQLKPGAEVELDLSERYVEELLKKSPIYTGAYGVMETKDGKTVTVIRYNNENAKIGITDLSKKALEDYEHPEIKKDKKVKVENKSNGFVCEFCGFEAKTGFGLKSHLRTHTKK